jgi:hypothetical protein
VQLKTDKAYTLTVYNLDGKVLLQKKINTTTQVDMSSYAYGVYIVGLNDESGNGLMKRIVKQ